MVELEIRPTLPLCEKFMMNENSVEIKNNYKKKLSTK